MDDKILQRGRSVRVAVFVGGFTFGLYAAACLMAFWHAWQGPAKAVHSATDWWLWILRDWPFFLVVGVLFGAVLG